MIKQVAIIFLLSCACTKVHAQDFDIITIAGCDTAGYGGDGGLAINAKLNLPQSISLDKRGNFYIADIENERIRKIDLSTGIITTIAGTGIPGFNGDNIPATTAQFRDPTDVFTDTAGNIFIAEVYNYRIRKITVSTGIITTVAGNGIMGNSGDGNIATNAEMNEPTGVCVDKAGNIYIADYLNNKVRRVDATTGIITTIAGNGITGYAGDNGPAINAEFNQPDKIFVDSANNVYISDQYNNAVRKVIATTGIITTIAGTGTAGYSGNGGLAINSQLNQPAGLYVDIQGNVFFADYGNGVIRRIDVVTGIISTVAGNGTPGYTGDGSSATDAELIPAGVLLDSLGIMYIADYDNSRIRMVYNTLGVKPLTMKNETSVYPNPVHDELNINGVPENTSYQLLSVTGVCVQQNILQQNNNTISIKNIIPGIYILALTDDTGERNMIRVVKE